MYNNLNAYFQGSHIELEIYETFGRFTIWMSGKKISIDKILDAIKEATGYDNETALNIVKKLRKDYNYTFDHDPVLMEKVITYFEENTKFNNNFRVEVEHIPIPYEERTDEQLEANHYNQIAQDILEQRRFNRLPQEVKEIEEKIKKLDQERLTLVRQLPEDREHKYHIYYPPQA